MYNCRARTCLLLAVCAVVCATSQQQDEKRDNVADDAAEQKSSASDAVFNWDHAYQFTPQNVQYARETVDYDLSSLQNAGQLNELAIPTQTTTETTTTQRITDMTDVPDYPSMQDQPPHVTTTSSIVLHRPRVSSGGGHRQQLRSEPRLRVRLQKPRQQQSQQNSNYNDDRGHDNNYDSRGGQKLLGASASNGGSTNYDVLPSGYHNMDTLNAMDLEIEPHMLGLPPTVKIETRDGQPYVEIYPTQPGSQPRLEISPFKRNTVSAPAAAPTTSSRSVSGAGGHRSRSAITSMPRRYERITMIENMMNNTRECLIT